MKTALWVLAALLVAPFGAIAAQQDDSSSSTQATSSGQQQESLADAARRAQAEKAQKKDQTKTPRVWDNDNIPAVSGNINVVGQASSETSSSPEAEQKPSTPASPEQKAAIQSELDSAKAQLDSLKADLDIAQRKYTLDEQTYLGSPNHQQDKSGEATLQDEKDDMAAKQQAIADAQKKIDDLQAQLSAPGNDSSK